MYLPKYLRHSMPFLETFITYGKREKWFFLRKKTKCRFVNHVREWFSSRDHETKMNTKEMKKKKTKNIFQKSRNRERSIANTKIILRWLATASLTYGHFWDKTKLFPGDFFCKFNGDFIFVAKTFSIVIHHLELWWISFHFVVFL